MHLTRARERERARKPSFWKRSNVHSHLILDTLYCMNNSQAMLLSSRLGMRLRPMQAMLCPRQCSEQPITAARPVTCTPHDKPPFLGGAVLVEVALLSFLLAVLLLLPLVLLSLSLLFVLSLASLSPTLLMIPSVAFEQIVAGPTSSTSVCPPCAPRRPRMRIQSAIMLLQRHRERQSTRFGTCFPRCPCQTRARAPRPHLLLLLLPTLLLLDLQQSLHSCLSRKWP